MQQHILDRLFTRLHDAKVTYAVDYSTVDSGWIRVVDHRTLMVRKQVWFAFSESQCVFKHRKSVGDDTRLAICFYAEPRTAIMPAVVKDSPGEVIDTVMAYLTATVEPWDVS
jgi:hypothetical protein